MLFRLMMGTSVSLFKHIMGFDDVKIILLFNMWLREHNSRINFDRYDFINSESGF